MSRACSTRKEKGKEELYNFYQNSKRWFYGIKMNRCAFVSVNRMRAGHTSLKASLNRFNIVSTAECECGDGLQPEEHIFWECKRYEEQRATMRDILSESSKVSYTALNARRKKISARRLLLHKQHSYIYLKIDP
jgi:hypothetical protein